MRNRIGLWIEMHVIYPGLARVIRVGDRLSEWGWKQYHVRYHDITE